MTLEERIKRIEDRLGITEEDNLKKLMSDAIAVCVAYGMSKRDARLFARAKVYDEYSLDDIRDSLSRRGLNPIEVDHTNTITI